MGLTQYVELVNQGLQVFSKATGASLLGPVSIQTLWSGFGGACVNGTRGDPVVLYDQLANRWVISQFAGQDSNGPMTDECIAVSKTSDATGSYFRYGFHLGADFFDYPKLGVWPDAYYMSMNVFDATASHYLGPQPFAFNRAAMLAGQSATFVTTGITVGPSEETYLPADLDGSTPPPAGSPNPYLEWPGNGTYRTYRFHVNWATPALSTFTLAGAPAAAGFSVLCPPSSVCVPQAGTSSLLDGVADRLMFRAAYRNFGGIESLVGNFTVQSGGVAGIRWFELRNVTSGAPSVFQESTYQPDSTWRWMGSVATDGSGDLALGFSASSPTINPQIRYAGRLAGDALNQLAQGETTLFAGAGSQTSSNRWGDYSDLTVDPVDDCTFWYANEYYSTSTSVNWRTRIASFRFPSCSSAAPPRTLSVSRAGSGLGTVTSAPAGIVCGSTCLHQFNDGASVTLTASSAAGSVFGGWSGTCSGTGPCTVAMNADKSLTATFTLKPPPKVHCIVPKVKGKRLRAAKKAIRRAHCSVGKIKRAFSAKVKKGHVISQKPAPGKKRRKGAKVSLVVRKG